MREHYLLRDDVTFLNHGSFGACPRPVFDAYQHWQYRLEQQPVAFMARELDGLLADARVALADFVSADADEVVFFSNATTAVNVVAQSLDLQPGDEILTTDHEYGAVDLTWSFVAEQAGARIVRVSLPMPPDSPDAVVEHLWTGVTPRTRVIAISHITSPTALILPVEAICQRAQEAEILTVIDGAHAPGHLPLNLDALGADFYAGNCHKWLGAPKGAGFLYARREHQHMIRPLVISWGYGYASAFVGQNEWQGTRDPSAFLAVPDAINFQQINDWPAVTARCHALAAETAQRSAAQTGLPPLAEPEWYGQMVTIPVLHDDIHALKYDLYTQFGVEVPAINWHDGAYLRISVAAYNTPDDIDRLFDGLRALLPA